MRDVIYGPSPDTRGLPVHSMIPSHEGCWLGSGGRLTTWCLIDRAAPQVTWLILMFSHPYKTEGKYLRYKKNWSIKREVLLLHYKRARFRIINRSFRSRRLRQYNGIQEFSRFWSELLLMGTSQYKRTNDFLPWRSVMSTRPVHGLSVHDRTFSH